MSDPINYMAQFANVPNPSNSFVQGLQIADVTNQRMYAQRKAEVEAEAMRKAEEAAKLKAEEDAARQAQLQGLVGKLFSPQGGTGEDWGNLAGFYPPDKIKQMQEAIAAKTDEERKSLALRGGQVFAALNSGNKDIAIDLMKAQANAYRNSGDEASAKTIENLFQKMVSSGDAGMKTAQMFFGQSLGMFDEGKQMLDTIASQNKDKREEEALPHELNLKDAQAAEAWANALRQKVDTGKVPDGALAALNVKVDMSEKALQNAYRYQGLAEKFDKVVKDSGFVGQTLAEARKFAGTQNIIDQAQTEWKALKASGILDVLPPGAASESDVKIAMGTFPDDNANPKVISQFLRGLAKIKTFEANKNAAAAEWMSNNGGSQGNAKGTYTVAGKQVKPGMTFSDFVKKNIPFDLPLGGSMIDGKYVSSGRPDATTSASPAPSVTQTGGYSRGPSTTTKPKEIVVDF